jgi:hypothetical protein
MTGFTEKQTLMVRRYGEFDISTSTKQGLDQIIQA